jgi:tetratricopeptide (TPR) repeat protein
MTEELERSGRHRELVKRLEAALAAQPPPDAREAEALRMRLISQYEQSLHDPQRALAHLEVLLGGDDMSLEVEELAERLLEHRVMAPRVAALLSDAYARLGRTGNEISMLTRELRLSRPPRLAEAQRRLAVLREEVLDDPLGALELLEALLERDPGDDDSRRRFVAHSIVLRRAKAGARVLSRALRTAKGCTRARVGLDIGLLHLADDDSGKALQAFAQVLDEEDCNDTAQLEAARRLLALRPSLPASVLPRALAFFAEREPDADARVSAARELLELGEQMPLEPRCEIAAWSALSDTELQDEALAKLETLYEAVGDRQALGIVLERRASREPDAAVARALAFRSAELSAESATDPEQALVPWRSYLDRYGASREAHAQVMPLLKRAKCFSELEQVLAKEAELTEGAERGIALARCGEVRLRHLSDAPGALELFRHSLELVPREPTSRRCLEELLGDPNLALPAARLLEPICRSEASTSKHAQTTLERVLAVRAEKASLVDERLQACVELGDTHASRGRSEEALAFYERAWRLDPRRTELLLRVDALALSAEQGPQQRLERYTAALELCPDTASRAELLCAIGTLQFSELHDVPAAIAAWERALEVEPAHFAAHEALLRVFSERSDSVAMERELSRALEHQRGRAREITLARLAGMLAERGLRTEALAVCRQLLDEPTVEDDAALGTLERLADDGEDVETVRRVFEHRVSLAASPDERARALERLGDFLDGWPQDTVGAARSWKAAADQYLTMPGRSTEAIRLFERALDEAPEDVEAVTRLIDLYATAGKWARLPELYGLLLRRSQDMTGAIELLLSLEGRAIRAGAAREFSELIEQALFAQEARAHKRPLLVARARVFTSAGQHEDAADDYRTLLESFAEEDDLHAFEALIDSGWDMDWRRENQRWLLGWRADRAVDPVPLLLTWADTEQTEFGDLGRAIAVLERAAEHDPSCVAAWKRLVSLKIYRGDVDGGLDALMHVRRLSTDADELVLELRTASTLMTRLDRPEDALFVLDGALEREPGNEIARDVLWTILGSESPGAVRARAGELLERASVAVDAKDAQRVLLEKLIDATEVAPEASKDACVELTNLRRAWFDRLLELSEGDDVLAVAERAAAEFPERENIWQTVEALACTRGEPEAAVRAYTRALERGLLPDVAQLLGQRLVAFAENYNVLPQAVTMALERVLELAPTARWALDRVKLALGVEQRWPALLALYDRAILAAADERERVDLLEEAGLAARDVVGDFDRAIGYWEQVFALKPGDAKVDLVLERLYERRGLPEKLIAHLSQRAEARPAEERRALLGRIAGLWLDLGVGAAALEAIEALQGQDPENQALGELLEGVFALPAPSSANAADAEGHRKARARAGELLRERYARLGRHEDMARVLEAELGSLSPPVRAQRLSDLFELRSERLGDLERAFECLGELVVLEPGASAHREKLVELAAELGKDARLAELLVTAADASSDADLSVELLEEAARVHLARLSDVAAAADLYARVLSLSSRRDVQLAAARSLEGLLDRLGRVDQRCDVLERLAALEFDPRASRAAILEAARVALHALGDPARAARELRLLWQKAPGDREVLDALVAALRAAGSFGELAEMLTERARLMTDAPDARRDLSEAAAVVAERLSDPERAIGIWRGFQGRFGCDAESFEALAVLLERTERWQELATLLSEEAARAASKQPLFARIARVHRDHTGDRLAAIEAFLSAMDPEGAAGVLEQEGGAGADGPRLALRVASALKEAGRLDAAERLLRRQLRGEPPPSRRERAVLHFELAQILCASGRAEDARAELALAVELYPTDATILEALARLSFEHGDLDGAERSYRVLLLLLRPTSDGMRDGLRRAEVYVELAELASRRGEPDRAGDLMASAFEAAAESEEEALGLERALRRRAKLDELERAMEGRLSRAGNPGAGARALTALAEFHVERGGLTAACSARLLEHADRLQRDLAARPEGPEHFEALRQLADVYRRLGHAARTIDLLDALSAGTSSAEDRARWELEAARLLIDMPERRAEAERRLRALVRRAPGEDAALALLARVLEEAGRRSEALTAYQDLARRPERQREALLAVVRLADVPDADPAPLTEAFDRLLEFEQGPARADLAERLVALREQQGDAAGTERALVLGFGADPARPGLRDALVNLYAAREEWDRVAATLERALELAPDELGLRVRLADARQKAGDVEAALRALDVAPASRSDKADLAVRRSQVLEAAGRYEAAMTELEAAYHLDARHGPLVLAALERTNLGQSSERWLVTTADILSKQGALTKARKLLQGWFDRHPESLPVLRRLGRLASRERDLSTAIACYERLLPLETGEARRTAAVEFARICVRAGRPADAVGALEEALGAAPKSIELHAELRKLYAAMGARRKEAEMVLGQAVLGSDPRARVALLFEAAELFERESAFSEALGAIEQARALDRESTQGVMLLSRILAAQGERGRGLELLTDFLRSHGADKSRSLERLYCQMAELHFANDDLVEGFEALSQAHRLNRTDPDIAFQLGMAAIDLDELDVAATALRSFVAAKGSAAAPRASEEPSPASRAYFHLAFIEQTRGHTTMARRMAVRSIEECPNNRDARRLIDELGAS